MLPNCQYKLMKIIFFFFCKIALTLINIFMKYQTESKESELERSTIFLLLPNFSLPIYKIRINILIPKFNLKKKNNNNNKKVLKDLLQ